MSAENEKLHGVKLPSGATIQVINKNDSERIRNAFKMVENLSDGTAKKLAAFVVRCKGMVLKEVVENFKIKFAVATAIWEVLEV